MNIEILKISKAQEPTELKRHYMAGILPRRFLDNIGFEVDPGDLISVVSWGGSHKIELYRVEAD